jgi:hypothetical protein
LAEVPSVTVQTGAAMQMQLLLLAAQGAVEVDKVLK